MGIKISLARLSLAQPFEELIPREMDRNGFVLLPLRVVHVARVAVLPFRHRDPFDRMLVAQCIVENLAIVSLDAGFDKYEVNRLW
jgi:PIN domain nuclease of toxin-antitoxin system